MAKNWVTDVVKALGGVFDMLVEHSDQKIEELKKKALHLFFVYGLFFVAVLFLMIGLIKYLAEVRFFASEGIAFMIIGSIMIVILAAYSMFDRA
jgi:hypothetical protein